MTLLLPELGFLALGLVVAWVVVRSHGADPTADERLAQQDLRRNRVIAALAGVVTFVGFAAMPGGLGRGLMVAPLLAGAVTMCLLAAGERNVHHADAALRRAALEPRSAAALVGRPVRVVIAACLTCLGAIVVLGWATASADDQGRAGRVVTWTVGEATQTAGPWPGSYYSVPALIALLVLGGAFAFCVRVIAQRPQVNADDSVVITDDQMRRRSARIVQGLLLLTLGVTLVGFSIVVFGATSHAMSGAPAWVAITHWCSALSAVIGIGAVLLGARVGATR